MTLAQAIQAIADEHNARVSEVLHKLHVAPAFAGFEADMAKYLGGCRAWLRGSLDWHVRSTRYKTGEPQVEVRTETTRGIRPQADSHAALE